MYKIQLSFSLEAEGYYVSQSMPDVARKNNPKFVNCVFKDNAAWSNEYGVPGGAFMLRNAAPIFESCVFDSNYAFNGGAIAVIGNSSTVRDTLYIRNSTIKNNSATSGQNSQNNGSVRGGGISFEYGINALILNSVFENNSAVSYGNQDGGVYGGGLGISTSWDASNRSMIWILNSRFTKNKINHFGGNTNSHGGGL